MPARTARLLPLCLGFTAALTAAALARAPDRQAGYAAPAPVQLAPPVRASLCSAITPAPQPAGSPVVFRDRTGPGGRLPSSVCGGSGPVQRT